jgi:hypothetical protein
MPLVVDYSASPRLVVDYFVFAVHPGASARRAARHVTRRATRHQLLRLAQARRRRLLCLRRASECLGTSHGSSCGSSRRSSSTTLPRAGSSSTISSSPHVWVLRHVARLVMWLVAPLVVDYSASCRIFVVDYFAFAARLGASARRAARHAARHAARRRLLRLAQARRRLFRLRRASGFLGTSRGSSCCLSRRSSSATPPRAGSSLSTTLPPPRVPVPQHVARLVMWLVAPLVVDYFVFAARPSASAHRAARHAARHAARCRLLRLTQARRRLLRLAQARRRLLRAPRHCLAATLALLHPLRAS